MNLYNDRLSRLVSSGEQKLLLGGLKGVEKESLRITADGLIAQTPHPKSFGSALAHPHITTDYSEALLEFITPPCEDTLTALSFLEEIHQFVYDNLDDELLLATSMPCGISGDQSIPIANYGNSNIGNMKTVYRRGLGYRYGRAMQAISGVHFNCSVAKDFWPVYRQQASNDARMDDFIAECYFALVRNLLRCGWLILYLFGASPAICKSFLRDRKGPRPKFAEFDPHTFYEPYATSLRMSDIGYKSNNQATLKISYSDLSDYVRTLTSAINTPFPEYEAIGTRVDGQYRQLNTNILQIENEYYSTVRPKQIADSGEMPTLALKRRGVRYIELRSLDIDLFSPIGVDENALRFLEALMLACLLLDSPKITQTETLSIRQNHLATAYRGRDPKLELLRNGKRTKLRQWALELMESIEPICEILDAENAQKPYSKAFKIQMEAIDNPDSTPSAKILADMLDSKETFSRYALRVSQQHEQLFRSQRLDASRRQFFERIANNSISRQVELETSDQLSFDRFLAQYFAQR